jgi:ATP-dependent RNA helicase MSS116, mitochondrial
VSPSDDSPCEHKLTVGSNHPKAEVIPSVEIIQNALEKVPLQTKEQAYVAFLGFTKALKKIHGLDAPAVVKLANRFSESLGLEEPPALEPSTVGKMGLKGVPGITIRRKTPGASGPGAAGGNGGRNRGPGGGTRKQPFGDSTPSGSAAESGSNKPAVGEPRRKRFKRESKGKGPA